MLELRSHQQMINLFPATRNKTVCGNKSNGIDWFFAKLLKCFGTEQYGKKGAEYSLVYVGGLSHGYAFLIASIDGDILWVWTMPRDRIFIFLRKLITDRRKLCHDHCTSASFVENIFSMMLAKSSALLWTVQDSVNINIKLISYFAVDYSHMRSSGDCAILIDPSWSPFEEQNPRKYSFILSYI